MSILLINSMHYYNFCLKAAAGLVKGGGKAWAQEVPADGHLLPSQKWDVF